MMHTIFTKILLFQFVLSISSISGNFLNDDISVIRQRVLELMIWPKPNDIFDVTKYALELVSTINSSCYWPDINYEDQGIVNWNTSVHMSRITVMLQALTVNGSHVQNNTSLRSTIHCALLVWLINDWQNPNWWFNQIYIPLQATSHLLMLDDNVTIFEIEKIKEISYRAAWWLNRSQDTGANLLDMLRVQLYRSLATNNVTAIEQCFTRIWQDIAIQSLDGQGIQSDWSYHFHGHQLLSGSYGIVWVNNVFLFWLCSVDTHYQADLQHLHVFAEFLTDGDAWMIIGNEWDWNVVGRSISRPENANIVDIKSDWIRCLAKSIQINETQIQLINFANRLDNQVNASLLLGNKHFYTSDYQVHRRKNWTSAIKMQSIRTQGAECTNGENIKDEHGGQGVLNLYTTDKSNYDFIFPLFDWQAINGITVEHDISLEPCINSGFSTIKLPFVGGVSDTQYGIAMMDTASHNLTAKRSWHFYDDAIIALATKLTVNTTNTVWTTLASRLLPNGEITIGFFNSTNITLTDGYHLFAYVENSSSNIQWIHVGQSDIVYMLQAQREYASLGIELTTKTGNYDTIGVYDHPITRRILTIWLNHGIGPYTLDYNYMIMPNVPLEFLSKLIKQYDDENIFSCMASNSLLHGTAWPSLRRATFVLWDNVTTIFSCTSPIFEITVTSSDAGAYLFSETSTNFTITASHPMRINAFVNVTISRTGYGNGCIAFYDGQVTKTNITLHLPTSSLLLGASVNVTCQKK